MCTHDSESLVGQARIYLAGLEFEQNQLAASENALSII